MAISEISTQYRYTGKGPYDAKSLVKTFDDLISESTWLSSSGSKIAYNGMVVAVWLDKNEDKTLSDRNGLYFLFDPNCTSTIKNPDVTVESNWHKIGEVSDIQALATQLSSMSEEVEELTTRVAALEGSSDVETIGYRVDFPSVGEPNKLYVAVDEQKTYIWFNDDYLPVGGSDFEAPEVIYGGSAE